MTLQTAFCEVGVSHNHLDRFMPQEPGKSQLESRDYGEAGKLAKGLKDYFHIPDFLFHLQHK